MYKKYLLALAICILFSGILFAGEPNAQKKVYRASIDKDGVQRVEIIGGGYYYNPDYIIVKVNVPVELKEKKDGLPVADYWLTVQGSATKLPKEVFMKELKKLW